MRLIIDISENVRATVTRVGLARIQDDMLKTIDMAIQSGNPLPEEHGDLIDRDALYDWLSKADTDDVVAALHEGMEIDELPTVIEAYEEELDE